MRAGEEDRRAVLGLLAREVWRESPLLCRRPRLTAAHLHNTLAFRGPMAAARRRLIAGAASAAADRPWLQVTNAPDPGPSRAALKGRLNARDTCRMAWRPGSELLAVTQGDAVHVWDTERRAAVAVVRADDSDVIDVAWSSDGAALALLTRRGGVAVWDARHWEVEGKGQIGAAGWCLAWHKDGELLAAGCDDGLVRLVDVRGVVRHELRGHVGPVWACDWSPAGHLLATGGEDNAVMLWAPGSPEPIASGRQHTDAVTALVWHPQGTALVSGGMDYRLVVWAPDLSTGALLPPAGDGVLALAFSPDGEWLASAGMACSITLEHTLGDPASITLWGHAERVSGLAWSPDGRTLASCANSSTEAVDLWDVPLAVAQPAVEGGHANPMFAAAFNRDASLVATSDHGMSLSDTLAAERIGWPESGSGRICVWDARDGALVDSVDAGYRVGFAIDWAADGAIVFSDFQNVRAWRRDTGTLAKRPDPHDNLVTALACHPREPVVASGSGDGSVRLWVIAGTGGSFAAVDAGCERVLGLAWSPDGESLAVTGLDGAVRVHSGDLARRLGEHSTGPTSVHTAAWSPDGALLAWADTRDTLALLDVATGEVRSATGAGRTRRVAFSPDGLLIATGSHEGEVAVWDSRSLERVAFESVSASVGALAFDQEGTLWCSDVGDTAGTAPLIAGLRLAGGGRADPPAGDADPRS